MGRALAIVIMVVGVSTFALLTAGIASFFVHDQRRQANPELAEIQAELENIRKSIAVIASRSPGSVAPPVT